ncbi:DNA polymerase III subunit delta' C-terminal domain-containing protein [Buchnera aphidicola]|uniref:DNA polymerase III subunit delta' n=1 Tax=Buchnera aphidicola subsp. Melaphis rhois TaxID=118103 RepID=A0A4D6YAH7_BUCMH|nr:DNA polymerase III subunit delta' C-terminal domain-containing protein [Buchnera aphidicola]QCI23341.1 DNA polymerase III subunit delta' [Buchnera aphidicola (Melaphis rhois)]
MNLYPWLKIHYENIICQLIKQTSNHAIILETQKGIGITLLIKNIVLWLICLNKKKIFFCKKCRNCQLINMQTYPDWYNMKLFSNKSTIGIDTIRWLCNQLFHTTKQNGKKVAYFSDMSQLTQNGTNGLLKALEEPPKNTYFLFVNYIPFKLLPTLRSRCISYTILPPIEQISIDWLKKENFKIKETVFKTALRINKGSPILAKKFLLTSLWEERNTFFYNLHYSIQNNNFIHMLNNFNLGNIEKKIFWLCSLLFDAIKIKYGKKNNVINLDKINIIQLFKKQYSFALLDNSIRSWMYCHIKLTSIIGINTELLLTEQLLRWEKILKTNSN